MLSVSEICSLTCLAAYPRRLPFLWFPVECILSHWREKSGQMWWVVSKWLQLIWKLPAQMISRVPFLLHMTLAAVSNWSCLTRKHGVLEITSLFHSYPGGEKTERKKISLIGLKVWQDYRYDQELRTGCTETLVS